MARMPAALPRSSPSSQGVDAAGLERLLQALEARTDLDPHGFMLVRHGQVVAEGWWAPYAADRIQLLYSLSKTFLSTAAGFAVDEEILDLDAPLISYFPEFEADIVAPRSRRILVRHALAMATGHDGEMAQIAMRTDPERPVRGMLLHEPEAEPGTLFAYNQIANYSVAAIIQRASGGTLVDYLRPRLFDPLGIGPVGWQEYPAGVNLGFSGLHATVEAIAKLGLLHLRDGVWEGHRVLPAGWAEAVRTRHITTERETNPDWRQGYGFQVWMSRHGYRGDGAFGQYCLILPEQDAVLAFTGATEDMQGQLDDVWRHLLPALDGPGSAEADESLRVRSARLELAPTPGSIEPAASLPDGEFAPPAEFPVRIRLIAGPGGPVVELRDDFRTIRVPVPGERWETVEGQVPVAVSGGWQGDDLDLDIAFLESPHRLHLLLRASDRTASVRWGTAPLALLAGVSPLDMAAPRPLG